MKTLWVLLFVSLLWCVLAFSCDKPPGNVGPGPDYRTPKGVTVIASVEVPPQILQAVDEGIQATITRMPADWTGGRRFSDYRMQFVTPDGCCGSMGNPYLVRGGIQTWGYVAGISEDPTGKSDHMVIVLPYQQDWAHPEWVSGTVWSESEHWVERLASIQLNDPEIFWKWQRQGADDTHPHRP